MKTLLAIVITVAALEVGVAGVVYWLRRTCQWLITPADLCPRIDKAGLKRFLEHGWDSEIGWIRKPGTSHDEEGQKGTATRYDIDSQGAWLNPGFEGREADVLVYGDSYAFARQVNNDETWAHLLSKQLGLNVINKGVGNYGLDQALLRLEREFDDHPAPTVMMAVVPETLCRILSIWRHFSEYGNTFGFKPRFLDTFENEIVGAVFPSGFVSAKRILSTLLIYGPIEFAKIVFVFLYHMIIGGKLKNMLRRRGIPISASVSLNSREFIEMIEGLDVDILVSITCPERLRYEILSIPRLAAINLHPSKLPSYRGILPIFNALTECEKEVGVSVHHMTESLDSGDIINKRVIPVMPGDDLVSLLPKVYKAGINLLMEAIRAINDESAERHPNGPEGATYYSYPSLGRIIQYHRAVARSRHRD